MGQGIFFEMKEATISDANFKERMEVKIPAGSPVRIIDISLAPDANFASSGKFGLKVGGQINQTSGSSLPSSFNIPAWAFQNKVKLPLKEELKGLILNPNEVIEIYGSMTSGTGKLTLAVTGELV